MCPCTHQVRKHVFAADTQTARFLVFLLEVNPLCSPQVLDTELKDLSTLVNQELECVNQIITGQPQEVPAQLLKALEKDAKNLQKSLSSVSDTWSSRLLHLQSAMEAEQVLCDFYY